MTNDARFNQNPFYVECVQSLLTLTELRTQALDETPEAEPIHERLNDAWEHLATEERDRLWGLSADLFMLSGGEVQECPILSLEEFAINMQFALHKRDWDEILSLLRRRPHRLEEAVVAHLRGRCWREFGRDDVAERFFQLAAHRRVADPNYATLISEPINGSPEGSPSNILADP